MSHQPASADLPFIMPFTQTLGVEVISASAERVEAKLTVTEAICTTGQRMHGGAIMAFADSLGAIGAYYALPPGSKSTTTIESKTNFLGGAALGSVVTGEATPMHSGRRTSVWQTRITDEKGKLVANVVQTQLVL